MFVPTNPALLSLSDFGAHMRKWHEAAYPGRHVDLVRTAFKAQEEMGEMALAMRLYLHGEREQAAELELQIAEECVDVVMVLFHLTRGLGLNLENQLLRKLQVIWDRLHEPKFPVPPPGPPANLGSIGLRYGESALLPTWYDAEKHAVEERILKGLGAEM